MTTFELAQLDELKHNRRFDLFTVHNGVDNGAFMSLALCDAILWRVSAGIIDVTVYGANQVIKMLDVDYIRGVNVQESEISGSICHIIYDWNEGVITLNTGRGYSEHGQRIYAKQTTGRETGERVIFMYDLDRYIYCELDLDVPFTRPGIMGAYDRQRHSNSRKHLSVDQWRKLQAAAEATTFFPSYPY